MPADPVLPEDAGSIAVAGMYQGLRRAGLGMIPAAVLVAAQSAMMAAITQAQQDPPAG